MSKKPKTPEPAVAQRDIMHDQPRMHVLMIEQVCFADRMPFEAGRSYDVTAATGRELVALGRALEIRPGDQSSDEVEPAMDTAARVLREHRLAVQLLPESVNPDQSVEAALLAAGVPVLWPKELSAAAADRLSGFFAPPR